MVEGMGPRRAVLPALALLVAGGSAAGQDVLRRWHGSSGSEVLGRTVGSGGDLDGDGIPDVAIAAGGFKTLPFHVQLFSGGDGELLADLPDPFGATYFGEGLCFVRDLDGDGIDELAVGGILSDDQGNPTDAGYVKVLSGVDRTEIWSISGQDTEFLFGARLASADVDGDAVGDLFVVAPRSNNDRKGARRGAVVIYSGATRGEIRRHYGDHADGLFGDALAFGSFDKDGIDDYLVGAGGERERTGPWSGHVYAYSGATGKLLYFLEGDEDFEWFGHSVAVIGDLDGDARDDFVVGAPRWGGDWSNRGRAIVISGKYGIPIRRHEDPNAHTDRFGIQVAGLGDCDRDGIPDYAIATAQDPAFGAGVVAVYSGATGALFRTVAGSTYDEQFGALVVRAGDFDQDGCDELAISVPGDSTHHFAAGRVDVVSFTEQPRPLDVVPARVDYRATPSVTITGRHFLVRTIDAVEFDGVAATNVQVVSDDLLTCDAPAGATGPVQIELSSALGTGRLRDVYRRTPAILLDGGFDRGDDLLVTYEFGSFDGLFAIAGLGPPVSIPTAGYDGVLRVLPFVVLFSVEHWPSDEFQLVGTIPDDPALVGAEVLLQALIGPKLTGDAKDASWTNCASFVVR